MNDPITWQKVARLDDLREGEPLALKLGAMEIAVYRIGEREVFALSDVCTHEYAVLSDGFIEDEAIECPLHQARFDIRTGKSHGICTDVDVRTFPVELRGDDVYVGT